MNNRIKELRSNLKISQDAFADQLNLSRNYIWMVEKGERVLSDRTISDICRVYGVNEDWLRTGSGEMFAPKDREQEIAAIVNEMMKNDESDFRYQLTKLLYELTPGEIEVLKNIAVKMAVNAQEKAPDDSEAT